MSVKTYVGWTSVLRSGELNSNELPTPGDTSQVCFEVAEKKHDQLGKGRMMCTTRVMLRRSQLQHRSRRGCVTGQIEGACVKKGGQQKLFITQS